MDRNVDPDKDSLTDDVSLSARRAWIEMLASRLVDMSAASLSARRAWIEIFWRAKQKTCLESLSARRAWIEIRTPHHKNTKPIVALRKESVDRNSTYVTRLPRAQVSLSARRAWIEITQDGRVSGRSLRRSPQGERG